jgi:hypothetical protein
MRWRPALRLTGAAMIGAFASAGFALDTPQWPPPEGVEAHMHRLQEVIRGAESTPAQREAARSELSGLLKSPAGRVRGPTPDEHPGRAVRAGIEPVPSVVRPLPPAPAPPPSGVAHVEVVTPPAPKAVDPKTGAPVVPSGNFAIDPRTGRVLHPITGGYVDPATGRLVH